jgi:hypothetical protein
MNETLDLIFICTFLYMFVFVLEMAQASFGESISKILHFPYKNWQDHYNAGNAAILYLGGFFKSASYIGICLGIIIYAVKKYSAFLPILIYVLLTILLIILGIIDIFISERKLRKTRIFRNWSIESIYSMKKIFAFFYLLVSYAFVFFIFPELIFY